MQANYQPFITRVINQYEGGYDWNKKDPGGPTKYGVTCFDLAKHMGKTMTSMTLWAPTVRDMSLFTAQEIYAEDYATPVHFNDLPSGVDCCVGDYAINSGISRAVRVAQSIVGQPQNGVMDAATVVAICRYDPTDFILKMCAERLAFMQGLHTWEEFGNGWTARVKDLQAYSVALVHKIPLPGPEPVIQGTGKATHDNPQATNSTAVTTAGSILVAGGTAVHNGWPVWLFAAVGGLVLVCGLAYVVYQVLSAQAKNATVKT